MEVTITQTLTHTGTERSQQSCFGCLFFKPFDVGKNPDWLTVLCSNEHVGKAFLACYEGRSQGDSLNEIRLAVFVDMAGSCGYDAQDRPARANGALFHIGADVVTRITSIDAIVFPHWDKDKHLWRSSRSGTFFSPLLPPLTHLC